MMKCIICGGGKFLLLHKGTRDVNEINVMKCSECGMVQLDNLSYNSEQKYTEGGMLKATYGAIADKVENMEWATWIRETEVDDDRRFQALKRLCEGKKVLEFGCGNGGFLRRIKKVASEVVGVELMNEARKNIANEGINVYQTLDEIDQKFDVVCMFMVIEHLNNPDDILKKIYNALNDKGMFICETVNSEDALLSKYQCKEFADFTYWSEHVLLFNSENLERIMNRNNYQTVKNTQMQRYSLGNHLYWLSNGKPGGI
jgi:2-polyprenyl-3-methyl-5-hydroxy-6-metoxy-1,4-benzoquinol methylase